MGLTRSEQMARIRGVDTRPEILLRRTLWKDGLRYRLRYKVPAGRPDLIFPGPRLTVFVDGCFWHGCPEHYVRPRSRTDFWSRKLRENVDRDIRQTASLEAAGWRVLRFWEHEVFSELDRVVETIREALSGPARRETGERLRVIAAKPLTEENLERWKLVDLRDSAISRTVERIRSTRKW